MSDRNETFGLHEPPEFVPLRDVALACLMFVSLTSYNDSLGKLKTGDQINLIRDDDRAALLIWLNEWGCRHLQIDQHGVASASILKWYQDTGQEIAAERKPLWVLDDAELVQAADAYSILAEMPGAKRGESVVGIPGTPHLIHPHVQNHPKRCPNRPRLPCRGFGVVKISVVSPYRHKAYMS